MKHFTKENILLALVSLLVLAQAKDLRQCCGGSERAREAIQQRGRMMDRSDWGPRMDAGRKVRKGKAEEASISPSISCCDTKS